LKALVVAGGDVPQGLLQAELTDAGIVICADGGARYLATTGRLPDILIGDMDSIDAGLLHKLESSDVEIIRAATWKDETDAQLAVDEAIARGADEIVMLGMLGGRIDHALGNLMLLLRSAQRNVRSVVKDKKVEITAATGAVEVAGKAGETVSLLPVGSGVSVRYLDGLRYGAKEPLALPLDSPVGVSNVMTADKAHIVVDGWAYLLIIHEISIDHICKG